MLGRVPAAELDATEEAEEQRGVDAAAQGDAVLAVGREREVLRAEGATRADLGGFLAEGGCPQAELAVALQCVCLEVDAPAQDQVAVEAADAVVITVVGEVRVRDSLSLWGEELDERKGSSWIVRNVRVGHGGTQCDSLNRSDHGIAVPMSKMRDTSVTGVVDIGGLTGRDWHHI